MHTRIDQRGAIGLRGILFLVLVLFAGGYFYGIRSDTAPAGGDASASVPAPARTAAATLDFPWPPRVGEPFPDLHLVTHTGQKMRLSELKGKVILIEPVGMTCPACNAFAGANRLGGYQGITPQKGLPSIEELLPRYAEGVELGDENIALVHVILYDLKMQAPKPDDAKKWYRHFGMSDYDNIYVMAADQRFIGQASYDMIPGFFLVDQDFVLRSDSTGHHPRHSLWQHLLPMVGKLLRG
jgi:hypothetical protein